MAKKRPTYDWDLIREEYVTGGDAVTIGFLARKYGPNRATVAKRSSAGDWVSLRQSHRNRIATEFEDKAKDAKVDEWTQQLEGANIMMVKALEYLSSMGSDELYPQEARMFIQAAAVIQNNVRAIRNDQKIADRSEGLTHEERVDRLLKLLHSRGAGGS